MKMDTRKILREYVEEKEVQDEIFSLPYETRKEIQKALENALMNAPSEEEQELGEISYGGIPEYKADGALGKMLKWVKRYLTDKASSFLINSSAAEMADTIDMLKVLDPYDMNGIFTPRAMYLGGGIDFAKDALSWRTKVEEFFGSDHVVEGDRLLDLVTNGEMSFDGLQTPAILNPLRAETVREEDAEFGELFKAWKANELDDETFKTFQKKIRENIVV